MRTPFRSSTFAAILVLLVSVPVAAGLAMAQEGTTAPANPGPAATAPGAASSQKVDDATLKQTAKAYVKVIKIVEQSKHEQSASNAGDAQKQQTAKQVESEKLAAVRAEGLEPQQYNHVIQLVEADPNLQQKFLSYVKEAGGLPTAAD